MKMWTVLWVENGKDRWDRLETEREVQDLIEEKGLEKDEDMMIFPPKTDDDWFSPLMLTESVL